MTQGNSPQVSSNQEGIHTNLEITVRRHLASEYRKPIAEHTRSAFQEALAWSKEKGMQSLVLDTGCGTGESSLHLAKQFPQAVIWGIDKSEERLRKKEESLPENLLYIRADLVDLWLLIAQHRLPVIHQALYYPNPWPKSVHFQRRWHGHPIFPVILQVGGTLELRTNWRVYAEEFVEALHIAGVAARLQSFDPKNPQTAFERKYLLSQHHFYKVETELGV